MKMKYAIDNMIDIIDGMCNLYMLVYIIVCIITIIEKRIVPFGILKDWFNIGAIIALFGMVFIPDKQQRKDMRKDMRKGIEK